MNQFQSTFLAFLFLLNISESFAQKQVIAPQQFNEKPNLKAVGTTPEKIAIIDSLLQSFVDKKKVSSVVGFVAKGGNIVYNKAYGWKDVENQVTATPDDYYILFSQTKAVTSVAFMTLEEKGLVAEMIQFRNIFLKYLIKWLLQLTVMEPMKPGPLADQ